MEFKRVRPGRYVARNYRIEKIATGKGGRTFYARRLSPHRFHLYHEPARLRGVEGVVRSKWLGEFVLLRDAKVAAQQHAFDAHRATEAHQALVAEMGREPRTRHHFVRSVMNGAIVEEDDGLPYCCSVASEGYWAR
jgi:hypothetical protein